jgi:probable DNA repair protein
LLELESELLTYLETGTVVVPSAQRAMALQLAHNAAQLQLGRKLWRSPQICSYTAWLDRSAVRAAEEGVPIQRVLRGAEEWLHWRHVVREAVDASGIIFDQSLAESLRRSTQTLHDWRIPPRVLASAATDESQLLSRVLRRFESHCADLHATASYHLPELLAGWQAKRPARFAGFVDPTPAQRTLFERLLQKQTQLQFEERQGEAFVATANDATDEISLMAHWCHAQLSEDPRRRLLVVVPDLAQRRAAVLRSFEQVLKPQAFLGGVTRSVEMIAVEGGQSLAHFPLVRHSLDTLRLLVAPLEFATFSAWLRAPFWQSPSDSERTRLDLWLRNWLRPEVSIQDLREPLRNVPAGLSPPASQLQNAIDGASRLLDQTPANASQWSRRFVAALSACGWPGATPLDSGEHQTRTRFLELLDEFAVLGATAGSMSALEAVNTLQALTTRVAFEPATGDTPVTITAALVDPIVRYDGIWVAGLQANIWPRPVQLDPFIPLAAQREAGIPASTAGGRLRQARNLLDVWRRSTAQLIVSWAKRGDDGEHLPSALLQTMEDAKSWRSPPRQPVLAQLARGSPVLESFEDSTGATWSPAIVLPSGTRSLEYQNLCPFRAYAELRLNCVPLETPRPGVDPRDRGRLLHRALEYLWTQLGSSEGLQASRGEEREALIEDCVSRATRDCFMESTLQDSPRAIAREQRRAMRLITQLCELEERRAPFQIRALEARRALTIGGASLEVRLDRMDELSDGTLVIFDYKTGQPRAQDWLAERPSNPQLLVYLRAAQAPVSALAAVHLTAARVLYRGIADRDDRLPKVDGLEESWPQQIESWHHYVERLVRDFLAGRAILDPLGDACRLCHLHGFCRVADATLAVEDVDRND